MSRGKQGVFTFVAVLATLATMSVAPVFAVTTSGSVAAADDRAPGPVSNVQAFLGSDGVEVSWELSSSDFLSQRPAGSDFTAGGTFVNVNDVVAYNVWRSDGSLDAELVGTVAAGETMFVDPLPTGSILTYSVTAADAGGNASAATDAAPVSLGDPGVASITPAVNAVDFGVVAIDEVVSESFVIANVATEDNANLSVSVTVAGAGFAVSGKLFTITPGNSTSLDVSFAAVGVGNITGIYSGTMTIRTNDPDSRETVISLSANIVNGLAAPDIKVTPLVLTFSQKRLINTTGTKTIKLENLGGLPLTGSFTVNGAAFSASASKTINRPPGVPRVIEVFFTPTTSGPFSGSVVFTTNDPDEPTVTVSLTGAGVLKVEGTGVLQTRVTKATVTFTDANNLDFTSEAAVNDFIDKLIRDLAALLGVDPSRIRNVVIRQGSIVADFTITQTTAAGEASATEALALLQAAVADPATNAFPSLPPAEGVVDASQDVTLQPLGPGDEPVLGWFTRSEDQVGFNDFFAFADVFGLKNGRDALYNEEFDIAPIDSPDGDIGFDDFFVFADHFGTLVVNADEIREALQ